MIQAVYDCPEIGVCNMSLHLECVDKGSHQDQVHAQGLSYRLSTERVQHNLNARNNREARVICKHLIIKSEMSQYFPSEVHVQGAES